MTKRKGPPAAGTTGRAKKKTSKPTDTSAPSNSPGADVVSINPRAVGFVVRIRTAMAKSVEGFIEAGIAIAEAKEKLDRLEFAGMLIDDLKMSYRTASRLMAIASHPVISNLAHVPNLPPSWSTLYELTRLPQRLLDSKLENGEINPTTERKTVVALIKSTERGQRYDDAPDDGRYETESDEAQEEDRPAKRKSKRRKVSKKSSKQIEAQQVENFRRLNADRLGQLENENQQLKIKIKGLETHLDQAHAALAKDRQHIGNAHKRIAERDAYITELKAEIEKLELEVKRLKAELASAKKDTVH
jgi:hypothetical protein